MMTVAEPKVLVVKKMNNIRNCLGAMNGHEYSVPRSGQRERGNFEKFIKIG